MNITFILPYILPNGGIRVAATYARKLTERGHQVTVISQPFDDRMGWKYYLKRFLGKQVDKFVPPPRSDMLDFLGARHKVLSAPRPPRPAEVPDADVIIATWWETAEWVAALPESKGQKFYLLQGYETFSHLPVERVIATYGLPLKKIAVSEYIRDAIAQNHGITGIDVVQNAVDIERFNTPERKRNPELTVGFVYATTPCKNIARAIVALEQAKARIPNLRARIFGAIPVSTSLPLPDWVQYERAPAQDDIPKLYASCDLWLFTSDHEGFGLPILEAMASRTPVLSTAAGAAPQIIDGLNGVLLPTDASAFADEIARFAQMSDADWQARSASARETATRHNWDDATDRLLALLQSH